MLRHIVRGRRKHIVLPPKWWFSSMYSSTENLVISLFLPNEVHDQFALTVDAELPRSHLGEMVLHDIVRLRFTHHLVCCHSTWLTKIDLWFIGLFFHVISHRLSDSKSLIREFPLVVPLFRFTLGIFRFLLTFPFTYSSFVFNVSLGLTAGT